MEYRHTPIMLTEAVDGLMPKTGGTYCDGTLGGGGHAEAICERIGEAGVFLGIDRDSEAIIAAKDRLKNQKCKRIYRKTNFEYIKTVLAETGIAGLDGALLDLGVSSKQLDDGDRGFSYMQDGPLDMRFDGRTQDPDDAGTDDIAGETGIDGNMSLSAEDVINDYSERRLCQIIKDYGEERWARRIASFIASERKQRRIERTSELVDIIKRAIPAAARREGPHPAKRTFQAIRIEVNDELGSLKRGIEDFIDVLKPGGRLAVITFHSLEDRIVKEAYKRHEDPCECPKGIPACVCGHAADAKRVTKKPVLPGETERECNPRARSAKLRIIEKLA